MPLRVRKTARPEFTGQVPALYYKTVMALYDLRTDKLKTAQKAVAAAMGISTRQFGRYEALQQVAPVPTLDAWATYLGMKLVIDLAPQQGKEEACENASTA